MGKKKVSRKAPRPPAKSKSLVDALFTSTQQRMLGLIFGQPDRRYFAKELITLAGKGSGAVQRELAAFAECGLVTVEAQGKQKYYSANRSSPIFEELKSITLKTVGLTEPIREALAKTKATVKLALIYGSVAKGTASATSDVDLLVVSEDLELADLYDALEPIEKLLARKLSPTLYRPEELEQKIRAENPFVQKVLAGDVIELIGEKNAFATA